MKNNIQFILTFLLLISSSYSFAENSFKQKYSDTMLTDDYGIVKEVDIIHDIKKHGRNLVRWQCFPVNSAKLSYTKWKENDPQGHQMKLWIYMIIIF